MIFAYPRNHENTCSQALPFTDRKRFLIGLEFFEQYLHGNRATKATIKMSHKLQSDFKVCPLVWRTLGGRSAPVTEVVLKGMLNNI